MAAASLFVPRFMLLPSLNPVKPAFKYVFPTINQVQRQRHRSGCSVGVARSALSASRLLPGYATAAYLPKVG